LYNLLNNNFAGYDSDLSILITSDSQSKDVSPIVDPKDISIQDFKKSELMEGKMLLNSPAGKTNNI